MHGGWTTSWPSLAWATGTRLSEANERLPVTVGVADVADGQAMTQIPEQCLWLSPLVQLEISKCWKMGHKWNVCLERHHHPSSLYTSLVTCSFSTGTSVNTLTYLKRQLSHISTNVCSCFCGLSHLVAHSCQPLDVTREALSWKQESIFHPLLEFLSCLSPDEAKACAHHNTKVVMANIETNTRSLFLPPDVNNGGCFLLH